MTIQITNAAATYINKLRAEKSSQSYFCLSTTKEGCSGLKYVVDVIEQVPADNESLEINGVKVFLVGDKNPFHDLIVDFIKDNLGMGRLIFRNRNAKGTCGCGESFLI
jgi:iron-sulfur cluster assembly accessory protein